MAEMALKNDPAMRVRRIAPSKKSLKYALLTILFVTVAGNPVDVRAQTVMTAGQDRIHFGDVIDIDVIGSFEFDWRGRLNPEGFLDGFDKVDRQIYVLCRTESEVATEITAAYSRMLRDPKVIVQIVDRSERPVAYVGGAVKTPQRFRIQRRVLLSELIVLAGGFTDTASGEISIFRPPDLSCADDADRVATSSGNRARSNEPRNTIIKISDILSGSTESNVSILGGDIVTVTQAMPIYVIGGVNNPISLSSRAGITLSRAIASAGGISKEGDPNVVTVFRREAGTSSVLNLSLAEIESRKTDDIALKPYDVVDVGQKGRPKRRFPPVIENAAGIGLANPKLPLRIID